MSQNWNPTYRKKESGAKEGLEKKMKYWEDRDYQYELGVTLGMAMNLVAALERPFDIEAIKSVFSLALEMKIDPEIVAMFDYYYEKKKKGPQSETVIDQATGKKLDVIQIL